MKEILRLNEISPVIDSVFAGKYSMVKESNEPVGIMLRSFKMHDYQPAKSVLCVGRAGAGVNNIPLDTYAKQGIVVFNAPGANANAVKELVILGILLSGRKVMNSYAWAQGLKGQGDAVAPAVEKGKSQFVGCEIMGKTLAVFGLGAIGRLVANAAVCLGMKVVGYDPYLSAAARSELHESIKVVDTTDELISGCNFITLHVPMTAETKEFVCTKNLSKMADGVSIINCARGELVNNNDVKEGLKTGKVNRYVTDFPVEEVLDTDGIITIPHLGASTPEAEDNCAVMAGSQLVEFIEKGNIKNSVNYPNVSLADGGAQRLVVLMDTAEPKCDQVQATLKANGVEVADSICNKGRTSSAALFNLAKKADAKLVADLEAIDGVVRARLI